MTNMELSVSGDTLTITVDLSKTFGVSASGKSVTVASSQGNVTIPGTDIKLGLNVYKARG